MARLVAPRDQASTMWELGPVRIVTMMRPQKPCTIAAWVVEMIDSLIAYFAGPEENYRRALVSVKGDEQVGPKVIRDFKGVLEQEKEHIGIFLTLREPTQEMRTEAAAGFWHSEFWGKDYQRIQILTIEEVLNGERADIPPSTRAYAEAPVEREKAEQQGLELR